MSKIQHGWRIAEIGCCPLSVVFMTLAPQGFSPSGQYSASPIEVLECDDLVFEDMPPAEGTDLVT